MNLPVLDIFLGQSLIPNDDEILGVLILGRQGEIERPRYHDLPVDNHDLIVGYVMSRVYLHGDSCLGHKGPEVYWAVRLLLSRMISTFTPSRGQPPEP